MPRLLSPKLYTYIPKKKRGKLDSRAELGILMRYVFCGRGYRILNPNTCMVKEYCIMLMDESNVLQASKQDECTVQTNQDTVECMSDASPCTELEWIVSLLMGFGINEPKPILLSEDSEACITKCRGESAKSKD